MSERFSAGIDWVTTPATLNIKTPDGKLHRFTDPHEASQFFLEGLSCVSRHFLYPLINPEVMKPDDRQKR